MQDDASFRASPSEVDVLLRVILFEVDTSLPAREEEWLSDDSLLAVDVSFDFISSAGDRHWLASWETPHGICWEIPLPINACYDEGSGLLLLAIVSE